MNDMRRMRGDGLGVRLDRGKISLAVDPLADRFQALAPCSIISMRSLTTPVAWSWRAERQASGRNRQERKARLLRSHHITFRRRNTIPLVGSLP